MNRLPEAEPRLVKVCLALEHARKAHDDARVAWRQACVNLDIAQKIADEALGTDDFLEAQVARHGHYARVIEGRRLLVLARGDLILAESAVREKRRAVREEKLEENSP